MSKTLSSIIGVALLVALFCVIPLPIQAGSGPSYCHDEAKNPGGSNRCTVNTDCDGARTCSGAGWCQGAARTPNPGHKGPTYCWNEAKNPGGSNRCTINTQCDGARTCSGGGWCQGRAGHASK